MSKPDNPQESTPQEGGTQSFPTTEGAESGGGVTPIPGVTAFIPDPVVTNNPDGTPRSPEDNYATLGFGADPGDVRVNPGASPASAANGGQPASDQPTGGVQPLGGVEPTGGAQPSGVPQPAGAVGSQPVSAPPTQPGPAALHQPAAVGGVGGPGFPTAPASPGAYPPPGWPNAGFPAAPGQEKKSTAAVVCLVLSIVSGVALLPILTAPIAFCLAVASIIAGVQSIQRAKQGLYTDERRGFVTAGFIISTLVILCTIVIMGFMLLTLHYFTSTGCLGEGLSPDICLILMFDHYFGGNYFETILFS